MSTTLLFQLVGPMQAWGVQSRFEIRETMTEPSKSGVIGLVCAALGRDRSQDISDLAALRMGVRVDREGEIRRDYQTTKRSKRDRRTKMYGPPEGVATLSTRYYLADAMFLVGLEGEEALLQTIDKALAYPHWPLSLGRKAFPPSLPIRLEKGLLEMSLATALTTTPRLTISQDIDLMADTGSSLRLILEASADDGTALARFRRPDQPISFEPRRFAMRDIVVTHCSPPIATEEENVSEQT